MRMGRRINNSGSNAGRTDRTAKPVERANSSASSALESVKSAAIKAYNSGPRLSTEGLRHLICPKIEPSREILCKKIKDVIEDTKDLLDDVEGYTKQKAWNSVSNFSDFDFPLLLNSSHCKNKKLHKALIKKIDGEVNTFCKSDVCIAKKNNRKKNDPFINSDFRVAIGKDLAASCKKLVKRHSLDQIKSLATEIGQLNLNSIDDTLELKEVLTQQLKDLVALVGDKHGFSRENDYHLWDFKTEIHSHITGIINSITDKQLQVLETSQDTSSPDKNKKEFEFVKQIVLEELSGPKSLEDQRTLTVGGRKKPLLSESDKNEKLKLKEKAQNILGDMYYHGTGTLKNNKKAFEHYKISAESEQSFGNAEAQRKLGNMYSRGEGYIQSSDGSFVASSDEQKTLNLELDKRIASMEHGISTYKAFNEPESNLLISQLEDQKDNLESQQKYKTIKNPEFAIEWLIKSESQGNKQAESDLETLLNSMCSGILTEPHLKTSQDIDTAIYCFNKYIAFTDECIDKQKTLNLELDKRIASLELNISTLKESNEPENDSFEKTNLVISQLEDSKENLENEQLDLEGLSDKKAHLTEQLENLINVKELKEMD